MSNPFRHDPHPDLTAAIRTVTERTEGDTHGGGATSPKRNGAASKKPKSVLPPQVRYTPTTPRVTEPLKMSESHTRAQLERLSITRLRELKKKYEALVLKGDKNASRELADIRGLLRSKGAGSVLDEESACERAAAKRLRDANAADLKEYPGKKGEAAHKRLHKTIKSVVGEGVNGDTVQEDLQTDERERETTRKSKQLHRAVEKEREGTAAIAKARARQAAHSKTADKEVKSKTVYGKGGKPVRKGSEQHKAAVKKAAAKKTGTASRGDERQSSDRRGYSAADAFNADNQRQWDAYYRARADADHREGKNRY